MMKNKESEDVVPSDFRPLLTKKCIFDELEDFLLKIEYSDQKLNYYLKHLSIDQLSK